MSTSRTPHHDTLTPSQATFRDWYGWEVPRDYGDPAAEYTAAREAVALHDSSYIGRVRSTGRDTLDLLNRLSTNAVVSLMPGEGAPTVLTNDRGRIINLVTVYSLAEEVLLLTSPGAAQVVIDWIDRYTFVEDAALEDIAPTTAVLSLIGPAAWRLLQDISTGLPEVLGPYGSAAVTVAETGCKVLRNDLVDLPRFDLIVPDSAAPEVWQMIASAGARPMGIDALEAVRIERGVPISGSELGEEYNPLDAGLWGSISFDKGCYIGQEVIARLDTYKKVQRHLVTLRFAPGSVAVQGTKLYREGRQVGIVTSLARVPTTGDAIGLGYLRKDAVFEGARVQVEELEDAWAEVGPLALPYGAGEVEARIGDA